MATLLVVDGSTHENLSAVGPNKVSAAMREPKEKEEGGDGKASPA
jgi:hypothetical protein